MSNSEQLTQAQLIDPGMRLAVELAPDTIEVTQPQPRGLKGLGRGLAMLSLAGTAGLGIGIASEGASDSPEALAAGCVITDPSGNQVWIDPCPGSAPTPTNPPAPSPSPSPSPNPSPNPSPQPTPTIPYSEKDNDGDGIKNGIDNCDNVPNPDQANLDGDIDGNACESDGDLDGDGILDVNDVNPLSIDNDADGLHDAFDPDSTNPDVDGDGFLDGDPTELEDKAGDGTLDLLQSRIDTDKDGYTAETGDTDENNTCVPDKTAANCDADKDGLTNKQEKELGTDPNKADTDGDKVNDKEDQEPLSVAGAKVDENGVATTTTSTSSSTTSTSSSTSSTSTSVDRTTTTETEVEEEEEDTTTTEAEVVAVAESNDDGNGTNWLLPAGAALTVGGIGSLAFVLTRRRRDESETSPQDFGNTSPVAGN